MAENNFKAIEHNAINIKGSQVFMMKQLFYDCVNGIKVENLGLGNPKNPQIDILIDHCRFLKQFNTGVYLSGVSLGCIKITSCNFERSSFGIYIEEFKSYGNFAKLYGRSDIIMTNLKMTNMRVIGIAIKELISNLNISQVNIKTIKKTPIVIEGYDKLISKLKLGANIELNGNKIKDTHIELMHFSELKKEHEAKIEERNAQKDQIKNSEVRKMLDFDDQRDSCALI